MGADRHPVSKACTVVIPCYNEAARFRMEAFEGFLRAPENANIRLLFVNDGSTDGTLAMLEGLRARFPERTSVLDQQPNRGKAEAVRNGMLRAIEAGDAEVTGFWDADLATPLAQIQDFLHLLEGNAELQIVFGARVRLLGRAIHRQPARHYLGRIFATVVSGMLRMPIYDTQCGAKLFRITPDLQWVLAQPFHSRWIFDVEILARYVQFYEGDVQRLEAEIYEFPLPEWTDVAGSKIKSTDFFRALGELVEIRRRHLGR
jgi:glycosyltransferase involved in cell wall biosynthesis